MQIIEKEALKKHGPPTPSLVVLGLSTVVLKPMQFPGCVIFAQLMSRHRTHFNTTVHLSYIYLKPRKLDF